jgi:hypothetical protein
LLLGNWGENSKLHAGKKYPLKLYTGDLDNNGSMDQILAIEKEGKYYTFLGKEEIEKQLPSLMRKKYLHYAAFAGQTIEQIFGEKLDHSKKLEANILSSVMLTNNADGKYSLNNLPSSVQWSPVFSFFTGDVNKDGKTDIISAGNFYGVLPYEGRYDAGFGNVLLNGLNNHFNVLSPYQSGFSASGEVRDIKKIKLANGSKCLLVARNNANVLFFKY